MADVTWYAISSDLTRDDRGPVDLTAALKVIDDYFARLQPKYDSAEVAIAETMFGFSRESNDFIEVCLHTPTEISVTVELPPSSASGWLAKVRGPFRHECTLASRDALRQDVTAYFSLPPEQFRARLAST
jgi:hypothetical protein